MSFESKNMTKSQTSGEAHPSDIVRENHRDTDSHVFPCAQIVTSPHCCKPLGAGVKRTGKNEGTTLGGRPLFNGLRCSLRKKHAVDIVNVSVFPTPVMNGILIHRTFWPIKDRRLLEGGKEVKGGPGETECGTCTSFISFQICTEPVLSIQPHLPSALPSNLYNALYHSQLFGLKKSIHALFPLQHDPWNSSLDLSLTSTPSSWASL